jgi:hypothetical protein
MNVDNPKVASVISFPLTFGTCGLWRWWFCSRSNIVIVNNFFNGDILGYEVS